jgi:hypothetical protein
MVERKNFAIRRFSIIFLNTVSYIGLAIVNVFFSVFFSFFVSMIYLFKLLQAAKLLNIFGTEVCNACGMSG